MWVDVIFSSIAAIIFLVVAIFVYFKSRRNPINRSFAIFLLCVSIWNIDIIGIRVAPSPEFGVIWGKVFRTGLLFIPPTFLHFTLLFTYPQNVSRWSQNLLRFFYIFSVVLGIVNWTPYFTDGIRLTKWGYQVISGPLYPLFILQFIVSILVSIYYLFRGYFRSDQYQRHRLKYFFLAITLSLVMGAIGFLPMFGWEVVPFGSFAVTIGLLIAAYSVAQHRLMDVSLFMAKGLGYVLTVLTFLVPTAVVLILIENYAFQRFDVFFTIIILTIVGFLSLIFDGVKQRINRGMQKIIVKDKYLYHQILEEFSRRLVTIVDLHRLLNMLGDTIEKSMGIHKQIVFLFYPEKENFRPSYSKGMDAVSQLSYQRDSVLIKWLEGRKDVILKPEVEGMPKSSQKEGLLKEITLLQAEVCIPLVYLDRLVGFIALGHKAEEEMYFREDLNLLSSLSNQIAISIENANLYENLKKSQTIMRRADRLASLGTLIAGLAHEIRNPLVSIKTFTQLLPERIDDEEFRNYFLTVASGEIDRLTSLINELLGFAKPTEPNFQGEDVNSIIEKMGFLISTEAKKKNITINRKYASDLPHVMADSEQIKQVLLNILLNGIQAISGDDGQIWIETRLTRIPREDGVEPFVQVEIRDNGVGISKENVDHIFDPFFTTRSEGSGLGLAITHQIVHEHGGFIDVESELGKGTSFRVNFPLKSGENGGPEAK